jgi:glycosyltransferase involved in cell wall biosynthesis
VSTGLRVPSAAIVQDWFFAPGGSENVALELADLLPSSDVYTTFADRDSAAALGKRLHVWPAQRILGPTPNYRKLLPLYPLWFERLDLSGCELVVSSSSAFAKAVRTRPEALHIAYIHTPMRFAWDFENYVEGSSLSRGSRWAARTITPWLQRWDRRTAQRPDALVANSLAVRERIRRLWHRDAEVIHPPVAVDRISVSTRDDGFLLVAARMLAYRRLELAIDACTSLGRELVVVGDGPERRRLERDAGPTVRFLGRLDRPGLLDLFGRCHAYLVPGTEDFGMAPVEAMAAGKPVVAFAAGGVLETVVDGVSGVLFDQQTQSGLAGAIERLDSLTFESAAIRRNAELFAAPVFRRKVVEFLRRLGVDPILYRSS